MIAKNSTQNAMWLRMQCFAFMLLSMLGALPFPSVVGGQEVVPSGYMASDAERQAALQPLRPIESEPVKSEPVHHNTGIQKPTRARGARATSANYVEEPAAAANVRQAGTTAPTRQYEAIPLRQPDLKPDGHDAGFEFKTPDGVVRNTAISLGLVLGLFLVVAWMMKKSQPRSHTALPAGVVEVLGRVQVSQKQQLQLIRMGPKLLLVSSTGQQMQTLGEISDPQHVEQLVSMCQSDRSGGISQSFRQIMGQYEKEDVQGFLGDERRASEVADEARGTTAAQGRRRRAWT